MFFFTDVTSLPMSPEGTTLARPDVKGGVRMYEGSSHEMTPRTAVALGRVVLGKDAFTQLQEGELAKGDALSVAQIAGIMAAKQTSKLLPLCQDVFIKGVDVEFSLDEEDHAVEIRAFTRTLGTTGVQMEALTAVSIAALTIYDMCKSISKEIRITDVQLLAKTGGQSGDYRRTPSTSDD